MSYTRPLPSAADFTWLGQSAYTRPAAATANLAFSAGVTVSGFTGSFGTPALAPHVVGFAGSFGTPGAAFARYTPVSGFAGSFGTPGSFNDFPVTGFAGSFGAAVLLIRAGFAGRFGIPAVATIATGTTGHFGTPTSRNVNRVSSLRGHFGTPGGGNARSRAVTGLRGRFGHPVALRYIP